MTLSQDRSRSVSPAASPALSPQIQQSVKVAANTDRDVEAPTDCLVRSGVSLKGLTTWKVGGLAQWYLEPKTLAETQSGLAWAKQQDLPITIIGAGSNLLISDRGLDGLVICTRHLRHVDTQFDRETRSSQMRVKWSLA
jgi:UDP-N-acetylmuramate dehydrogenase